MHGFILNGPDFTWLNLKQCPVNTNTKHKNCSGFLSPAKNYMTLPSLKISLGYWLFLSPQGWFTSALRPVYHVLIPNLLVKLPNHSWHHYFWFLPWLCGFLALHWSFPLLQCCRDSIPIRAVIWPMYQAVGNLLSWVRLTSIRHRLATLNTWYVFRPWEQDWLCCEASQRCRK